MGLHCAVWFVNLIYAMILLPKPPGIHSLIFQLTKTHTQLQKVSVLRNSYWIYCIYQTLQKRIIFLSDNT